MSKQYNPDGNTLLLKDKSLNDRISAAFHKIEINMDEVHAIQLDPELMSDLEILKQKSLESDADSPFNNSQLSANDNSRYDELILVLKKVEYISRLSDLSTKQHSLLSMMKLFVFHEALSASTKFGDEMLIGRLYEKLIVIKQGLPKKTRNLLMESLIHLTSCYNIQSRFNRKEITSSECFTDFKRMFAKHQKALKKLYRVSGLNKFVRRQSLSRMRKSISSYFKAWKNNPRFAARYSLNLIVASIGLVILSVPLLLGIITENLSLLVLSTAMFPIVMLPPVLMAISLEDKYGRLTPVKRRVFG